MEEEREEGFADDEEFLNAILQQKIGNIKAFKDEILQHQYEELLSDEDELLSLDRIIAAARVRYNVAVRKGTTLEVAQLLRSVTDAIDKAIAVREKHREYVHLEQVLWLLEKFHQIAEDEVSDQDEIHAMMRRLQKLVLIPRDEIPLDIRKQARALAEGRRAAEKK